jgi:5-methyltetrahydrofolate--homocysteine methyltransferase
MIIVGERINSSRQSVAAAVSSRDKAYIQKEAIDQASAGADYLEVNAGSFSDDEPKHLKWLIETAQESVDVPLCIDSPDPAVIKSLLPITKKPPMINSATLEPSRCEPILRMAAEHGAKVVALCQGEGPIAATASERVDTAEELIEKAQESGLEPADLFIDPLVYPLATDARSALTTLRAIQEITTRFPSVHTICGLSNISYGLPNRRLINRSFLVAALYCGLDAVLMDPTDKELYAALKAGLMVCGRDDYCMDYISAFREGRL